MQFAMRSCTHVCIHHAVARAAPALLPRCQGSIKRQHRLRLLPAAETAGQTAVDQRAAAEQEQEQQQVPLHIARRLAALQDEVQQAYESGFKAGYTAGVKVQVNVGLDMGSSSSSSSSSQRQQEQQQQQQRPPPTPSNTSRSNTNSSSTSATSQDSNPAPAGDSLVRSAVKGLVWRLFSTAATVGIALLLLHDVLKVEDALKFGALEFTVKFMLYFAHERLWASVKAL